jgi:hypothetical protein
MDNAPPPRPVVGAALHLVLLRDIDTQVLDATVRFDRGRGLVLDLVEIPESPVQKGERVLLNYAGEGGLYVLRGSVSEVLTVSRVYVLPASRPALMEKREYIRAVVPVEAALSVGGKGPPNVPLRETSVELSASGFRWFGADSANPGDRVWLCLRMPRDGRRACVPSTVIRCDPQGDSFEVAGHFDTVSDDMRDALLDLVYRRRLADLGIAAGKTWDDDG